MTDGPASRTWTAVSTITLAELAYGLHTPDPLVNAAPAARYCLISQTFDAILFDSTAARTQWRAVRDGARGLGAVPDHVGSIC